MSEQESTISSESDDVEAHGRKRQTVAASEEPTDEATSDQSDDDVELHGKKRTM